MDLEGRRKLRSSIHCLNCDTEIVSKHRHDYVGCKCRRKHRIYLDGGIDYTRMVYPSEGYAFEDTSVYDDGKHETRRNNLYWGSNYDKEMNLLPETKWNLIKDLETSHIENILSGGYVEGNSFYKEVFTNELSYRRLLTENP